MELNLLTIEIANISHTSILSFHLFNESISLVVGGRQSDGSVFFEIRYYMSMFNIFLTTSRNVGLFV